MPGGIALYAFPAREDQRPVVTPATYAGFAASSGWDVGFSRVVHRSSITLELILGPATCTGTIDNTRIQKYSGKIFGEQCAWTSTNVCQYVAKFNRCAAGGVMETGVASNVEIRDSNQTTTVVESVVLSVDQEIGKVVKSL